MNFMRSVVSGFITVVVGRGTNFLVVIEARGRSRKCHEGCSLASHRANPATLAAAQPEGNALLRGFWAQSGLTPHNPEVEL